ncbi:MAG: DUF1772 domain-containing protein [Acidobacteria bacterium]|nr:DUF1772 domain-containing protein [Acidobacteriota bacterium]
MSFVGGAAILLGGSLYSSRVVEQLWSSNPPESLRQWGPVMQLAGARFFRIATPSVGLLALLTLLTSFGTPWPHRRWRLAASTLFLGVVVWSVVYFVPTALMLSGPELDDIPPAQAIAETAQWVRLDDFRMLLVLAALACGARALYVPARG